MNKREKILTVVILILVLINSATLILMWVNKPPFPPSHPPHEGPAKIIIERLQLDEEQQKEFEIIKKEHQGQMRDIHDKLKFVQQKYFELLKEDQLDSTSMEKYSKELSKIWQRKEQYTFEHFVKLKAICKPEQIKLYNEFIGELGKILSGPKHPPPHP